MNLLVICPSQGPYAAGAYVVDLVAWHPTSHDELSTKAVIGRATSIKGRTAVDSHGYAVRNTLHDMQTARHPAIKTFPCHVDEYVTIYPDV